MPLTSGSVRSRGPLRAGRSATERSYANYRRRHRQNRSIRLSGSCLQMHGFLACAGNAVSGIRMVGCTTLKFAKIAPEQPIDYVNDTTLDRPAMIKSLRSRQSQSLILMLNSHIKVPKDLCRGRRCETRQPPLRPKCFVSVIRLAPLSGC